MSSYLSSNQPYQRVDDGIGAGLIGGAVVGAAAGGAFHRWGATAGDSLHKRGRANINAVMGSGGPVSSPTGPSTGIPSGPSTPGQQAAQMLRNQTQDPNTKETLKTKAKLKGGDYMGRAGQYMSDGHASTFGGSWKRKAAGYGASILAGSLLGGVADGIID